MAKMPFMKFYPQDYLYDTRILTPEERGIWMDLICFLWNSPERGKLVGYPQDLAQMVGMEWGRFRVVIDALKTKNIINLMEANDKLMIVSRRMVREEKHWEYNRIRVKRHYEKNRPNAILMDKKSEAKKSEVIKDIRKAPSARPAPKQEPLPETGRPLTDLQKVVTVFKMVSGHDRDDKSWDEMNFARCAKSAKALLKYLGHWKAAGDCVQDVYERLTAKGLSCTLETICKHAADWKKDNQERLAKGDPNGILPLSSVGSRTPVP